MSGDDTEDIPPYSIKWASTIDRINAIKREDPDYDHENDPEWHEPQLKERYRND